MAKPIYHAINSSRKFGGAAADYQDIHDKMDSSKSCYPKMAHRLVYHNTYGHQLIAELLGPSIQNADGVSIPTQDVCNQHTFEDLGYIPTLEDYSKELPQDLVTHPLSVVQHSARSARRFGGQPEDYDFIHAKMLEPATCSAGNAIFHSSFGIYIIEELFGTAITNSSGKLVAVRDVAEQHVLRVCKIIPTLDDWLREVDCLWMVGLKKARLVLVD